MPKQESIKFINNPRLSHSRILEYVMPTITFLKDTAIIINKSDLETFLKSPFEIVNKHALVFIDAWNTEKYYDWSAFINKITTHSEKDERNCNIIIATKRKLSKTLMRSSQVKLIDVPLKAENKSEKS